MWNQRLHPTFLAILWIVSGAHGNEFILVDAPAGVAPAPLILFPDAPQKTKEAAVELADYIERSCGLRPRLLDGSPSPPPSRAVWLGRQPTLDALFPELDLEFRHPEEVLIAANSQHLVIAGRDRWDPTALIVEGIDEKIVGNQQEYGTVNAIYTFLQDQLGVRWLWPGPLGEDVPHRRRIAFKPFEERRHPPLRARGGAFNFSQLSNKGYGRSHQWTRRQRLQLDSLRAEGGHAFGDWHARFHATQPELFALQPDGTRGTFPSPKNVKLCQSNPKVWKQWLADVEAQLQRDPTLTEFNASPNDGWSSGHCVCENCRAWDHPDGEPRVMHWHKHRETRPALSDRHVRFANHLADVLKRQYPDKDYHVLMLCYGHSRPAPMEARPRNSVIMVSVANFLGRTALVDRGSTWGVTHRDQFAAWGKRAQHLMWRPNTGSPAGWQQGLPDVSPMQTARNLQFVADNRCVGIYIDAVWEHWATQGPQYYLMAQLIWDPSRDAKAVLDDYYDRAFGPAADDVRRYFARLEEQRMAFVGEHGYSAGLARLPQLYTSTLLDDSQAALKQALAAIKGDSDAAARHRQRVQFVQAGLDYTRRLIENIGIMEAYWEGDSKADLRTVLNNWKQMEQLCRKHPYAINWRAVRPSTPRMLGLHPDHPNPKRKPAVQDLDQN